ncbi:protein of unknown function [Paraburkholderia kururiensis]
MTIAAHGRGALVGQKRPLVRNARMAEDKLGSDNSPGLAFGRLKICPHIGRGIHGTMLVLKQLLVSWPCTHR